MNIKIILPTCYDEHGKLLKVGKVVFPNLTILYLAGMVPKEHPVTVTDESLQDIDFDTPTDLVGISVNTPNASRAYEVADEFRKRGVTVVLGGIQPTFLPDEARPHADALVIGEAEDAWPALIRDREHGDLKPLYRSARRESLANLAHPRFDLIDYAKYVRLPFRRSPMIPIQTARGCPHDCEFCSVSEFWGQKLRVRPVEEVVAEIQLSRADTFFFTDDNFFADTRRARQLMEALVPLKIKYFCQLDTTVARHPELLKLLAQSGCMLSFIGIESLSPASLKRMKKGFNRPEEYKTLFQLLHRHGINVYASIIVGFDGDDQALIHDTVDFLIKQRTSVAAFFPLTPFPGTPLYDRLKSEQRLIADDWWLGSDYASRFIRIKYGPGEATNVELRKLAMERFYALPSIVKRYRVPGRNRLLPLLINMEIRRRIKKSMAGFL